MYFDIHDVLKKLYPDDEILRDNIGHEIDREGRLLTPEMNIQKLTFFVRGIFSEMQNKEYMFRDMVAHFQIMLVTEIIRKLQNTDLPERGTVTVDIFPAVDYIKKNYAAPIRAADLARSCGMSESYFRRVFEKYMNMKPMDYVNFVRIQRACALLRKTDLTIALVSDKAGYESVSTFIRNFKRVIGCTPNKWKSDEKYVKNKFMNYNITALKGVLLLIVPKLYEDLSVLHQNTMPDRAYYIPSSGRDEMLVRHRERSDRLELLSGCDWNFAWYPGIDDLKDLFYLPDYKPGNGWKKEKVPFCWQEKGEGSILLADARI